MADGLPVADPLGVEGTSFSARYVEAEPGVELRVLGWRPSRPKADPVVLVAGWISVVAGWASLLEALVAEREVCYLETREKRSARVDRARLRVEGFTLERLADDLVSCSSELGVDLGRALVFASSMGANAVLEALKHDRLRPRASFLIGPNAEFVFPSWGRLLLCVPASAYHLVRPFVAWYLRRFRVDARREPEQMARYERTLRAADPVRLKLSARAVLDYRVWPALETITTPVALAYAHSDALHGEEEVRAIAARVPRGRTVCCESNTYMHTAGVTRELDGFLSDL